ncbi:unnamed protein product, partial [Ectocarpus sp. 8 AP-2014]
LSLFSFGAPRAGNPRYAARYNAAVPRSFRIVVDGDPVPGLPTWRYGHAGTKVLIDGRGRGPLILDPSLAEQRVFPRSERRRYVHHHDTGRYRQGLRGRLLEAVLPEVAAGLPNHWPFAPPASTPVATTLSTGNTEGGTPPVAAAAAATAATGAPATDDTAAAAASFATPNE